MRGLVLIPALLFNNWCKFATSSYFFSSAIQYKLMIQKSLFLILFLLLTTILSQSLAEGKFNFSERAKKREGSRWTLSEWLAQKERNRAMDMWLAMNSPSPFEFSLLGANTNYKKTLNNSDSEYTISTLEASAYARIFGLSVEHEKRDSENENDLTGLFNFRLWGDSIQSSALTLHYGQRTRSFSGLTPNIIIRNQIYQVSLQIYLSPYFGINGYHRNFLPQADPYFGEISGYQNQAGAFIDFEFVRIFGTWFEESQKNSNTTAVPAEVKRNGIKTGIQLFF